MNKNQNCAELNNELFEFISACPTAFHAVREVSRRLEEAGFIALSENRGMDIRPGGSYYVTRNGSSLIAFRMPEGEFDSFMMTAAHLDSPAFRIRDNSSSKGTAGVSLSAEKYGGMLCASWLDRPLSAAGRVAVRTGRGVELRLIDSVSPVAVIPSVAIHMNRSANENASYNAAVDMVPLFSAGEETSFSALIAKLTGEDENNILSSDLCLYNPEKGEPVNDLISAPRLDDLQCVFGALKGFTASTSALSACPVLCLFDNEEVGSTTMQGAASTFLRDVLSSVCACTGKDLSRVLAGSFMVSCDNAHAVHPNHPELSDRLNSVKLNGGIAVKYNANRKYTSDGLSTAIFRLICEKAGVPVQLYANRPDIAGGSTLGNISNTHVPVIAVDIGLPQLAMHSCRETAGALDTEYLVKALEVFYNSVIKKVSEDSFEII